MGDREGVRQQLTVLFVGHCIGQDMGGFPEEWRTEVSQVGTVSTPCWTFIPPDAHSSTAGVSMGFRPHGQRETVPSGFVELSTYRVSRTSEG
jgi:hypothetical protein